MEMRRGTGTAAAIWALFGILLLASGPGWGAPNGEISPETAPVSDAASFAGELRAAGALKFYENTEDLLRTGQFERALLRYAFLKGQIARQPGYRPLVSMVNQRLHFLQGQLRLPVQEFPALQAPRIRQKPPEKKEADQAAVPPPASAKAKSEPDDQTGEAKPANEVKPEPAASPPGQNQAAAPQTQESAPKAEDAQPEAEKPPPPPPSRWQRLKKRLMFWKK